MAQKTESNIAERYPMIAGLFCGLFLFAPHWKDVLLPLQLIAFVPFFWVLDTKCKDIKKAAVAGLFFGLYYTIPLIMVVQLPLVICSIFTSYFVVLWVLIATAIYSLKKHPILLKAFAITSVIVIFEYINMTLVPMWGTAQLFTLHWSLFPWAVQFVAVTGTLGITFVLVLIQALTAAIITDSKSRVKAGVFIALILLIALCTNVYYWNKKPDGTIRVAAIGWASPRSSDSHKELYEIPIKEAASKGAKLIVTPEYGLGRTTITERKILFEKFKSIAKENKVMLVLGYGNSSQEQKRQNKLVVINNEGKIVGKYTKTHLTFGEKFIAGNGELAVVDFADIKLGTLICHDDNYTDLSRPYGLKETSLLAVPTNDWSSVKKLHLRNTLYRAMEGRSGLIRGSSYGISAIISPNGKIAKSMDHFKEGSGYIVADIPFERTTTLYHIFGEWLLILCCLFLAVSFIYLKQFQRQHA
ncbi:MAG: hypothetical protein KAJ75_01670 [Alphaproteobacteria bacterium]|nr:hypothetical protein [Alphaproteobacteria bacterium]